MYEIEGYKDIMLVEEPKNYDGNRAAKASRRRAWRDTKAGAELLATQWINDDCFFVKVERVPREDGRMRENRGFRQGTGTRARYLS